MGRRVWGDGETRAGSWDTQFPIYLQYAQWRFHPTGCWLQRAVMEDTDYAEAQVLAVDGAAPPPPAVPAVPVPGGPGQGRPAPAAHGPSRGSPSRTLHGTRLALVLGCSNYSRPEHGCLPLAAGDATAVASLFAAMGYSLIRGGAVLNPSGADMRAAVCELVAAVADSCTVVVYFSGHGLQNFLLPADADTSTPERAYLGCGLLPCSCSRCLRSSAR
jgi:hypothetical protein